MPPQTPSPLNAGHLDPPDEAKAPPCRCAWVGATPIMIGYHDREWGVPVWDDRALWEKLVLDGFQAGLAWITILRKREAFQAAFDRFDPEVVARYGERDIQRLLADPGIVRSRSKIEAAIAGARVYLDLREAGQGLSSLAWGLVGGEPLQNAWSAEEVPAETPLSREMSKALKSKGFKFAGPVIAYAWMQATGLVNDHLASCFRHQEVARLGRRPQAG